MPGNASHQEFTPLACLPYSVEPVTHGRGPPVTSVSSNKSAVMNYFREHGGPSTLFGRPTRQMIALEQVQGCSETTTESILCRILSLQQFVQHHQSVGLVLTSE
jgi:hypothetical protein